MDEQDNDKIMIERYKKIVNRIKTYNKEHPEKIKEIKARYYENFKKDDEKYAKYKEKRQEYYINVIKPKKELLAAQKKKIKEENKEKSINNKVI